MDENGFISDFLLLHGIGTHKKLEPGMPCKHPGCANHVSKPCEGCGRYAAGTMNGPSVDAVMAVVEKLKLTDPVIRMTCEVGQRSGWSDEQLLAALVMCLHEALDKTRGAYRDHLSTSIRPHTRVWLAETE